MLSITEIIGAALGIINVILAARGSIWCWIVGIISAAMYVYLNFQWQLYYDMILQLFYVFAGFYGWYKWSAKKDETPIPIISWRFSRQMPLLIGGAVLSIALGAATHYFLNLNAITYFDAALTVFSFIATWMMAKKIIENWLWWIVIDTAGIGLYLLKQAPVTAVLYLALTLGAVYAYYNWRKQLTQHSAFKSQHL